MAYNFANLRLNCENINREINGRVQRCGHLLAHARRAVLVSSPDPSKRRTKRKSVEGSGAWAGVHQELRNATGGAEST